MWFLAAVGALVPLLAPLPPASGSVLAPLIPADTLPVLQVHERGLPEGGVLLVAPERGTMRVGLSLVIPAGRGDDPPERAGLADLVARLVAGSPSPDGTPAARAVGRVGGTLAVAASQDFTTVAMEVPVGALDEGLRVAASVLARPSFTASALDSVRSAAMAELLEALRQPSVLASRALSVATYGSHPYGTIETPGTLKAIRIEDVVRFHRAHYRPAGMVAVASGDVDPDTLLAALEEHLAEWAETVRGGPDRRSAALEAPGPPLTGIRPPPRSPDGTEGPATRPATPVVLIHLPGAARAAVRVGHLLPPGNHPDWPALSVGSQLLGVAGASRLPEVLRSRESGTFSIALRRRGEGLFQAGAELPADSVASAVNGILTEMARAGTELAHPRLVEAVRDRIFGPTARERPAEAAARAAGYRLLGLEREAVRAEAERFGSLDAVEVRDAVRAFLHPSSSVVVVAGDASVLRPALAGLGPVTLLDARGDPVARAGEGPPPSAPALDASALRPGRWRYQLRIGERILGTVDRRLEFVDEASGRGQTGTPATPSPPGAMRRRPPDTRTMRLRSSTDAGGARAEQDVRFHVPEFRPLEASVRTGTGAAAFLTFAGGRAGGWSEAAGRRRTIEARVPPDALVGEMQELALWIAGLEDGDVLRLPVVSMEDGAVEVVTVEVVGQEAVEVPAGRFEATLLELRGGALIQRVHVRRDRPHVVLRVETGGQAVTLELASPPGGT